MTQCKHFMVDTVGFGAGIGNCQLLVDYQANGATERQIENIKRQYLGTRLFWYAWCDDNARECLRYESLTED